MMTKNRHLLSGLVFAFMAISHVGLLLAAGPPAGQMCPKGSFVIGFDAESNIICSEVCGNHIVNEGESCDDGNTTAGDGCSAHCQSEVSTAVVQSPAPVAPAQQPAAPAVQQAQAPPVPPPPPASSTAPAASAPTIAKIKPKTVVFQAREVKIAITGSGFNQGTTVVFSGQTFKPSVNAAGTELRVTLPTRELPMGYQAITVSNGPGLEVTLKKGIEIF